MASDEGELNVDASWHKPANFNNEEEEISSTFVDDKILRMMKMMGYQSGFGLGKNKQGMIEPVTVEHQLQRRGLGLKIHNLDCTNEEWDFSLDSVSTEENLEWLQYSDLKPVNMDDILTWSEESKPNVNMEEEYNFCDKDTLHNVIKAKNIFDELDLRELCLARARANPFETIRSVFFMNRAALKMANIDAATGFMFTNIDEDPHHKNTQSPVYFADVCAGPGGFTEYVLWRKNWQFKGFGFTLKGENDFKLTESVCASPVTFLPLYGAQGDGNVCCPENIDDFTRKVMFETENQGVHFMMSDGGFSVEGNENIQEILSKNIYICQCLVALGILRQHGHFVTKVFDMFTCFSVGLLFLMCNSFEKVCILKPNSSRPANSERYLICCNYKGRENVRNIRNYIRKLVERLWKLKDNPNLDITGVVPLSVLKDDHNFYSYICKSNNSVAKNQTISLQKLAAFCRNPLLIDHRQEDLRKSCLQYWQIPDKPKVPFSRYTVDDLLLETVHNRELLLVQSREIYCPDSFEKVLTSLSDWHYVLMQCRRNVNICNFYAGIGFSKVYRLQHHKWVKVKNLQLPRGTLLYGELVKEKYSLRSVSSQVQCKYSLHVIDAARLGDLSLTHFNFEERNNLINTFCKSVNHEFRPHSIRIRPKVVHKLESISSNLSLVKEETSESSVFQLPVFGYDVKEEFYEVNSILFLKTNQDQSFHSTYVLRMQFFLDEAGDQDEKHLQLESLVDLVKSKAC